MQSATAVALAIAISTPAFAGLTNPLVPGWRGEAGTTYGQWEAFVQPFGCPNECDVAGSSFLGALYALNPLGYTGIDGNIYADPGVVIPFVVEGALPGQFVQSVIVNVSTELSELDLSSVQLTLHDEDGMMQSFQFSATALQSVGDESMTRSFTWNDLSADLPIGFVARRVSVSFRNDLDATAIAGGFGLDALSIDIISVPAPGSLALLATASLTGGINRRRRRE